MAKLNLILTLLLLSAVIFSTIDVHWSDSSPHPDSQIKNGEYYNQSKNADFTYSYAYKNNYLYLGINTNKVIQGTNADSIRIYLNDDIQINLNKDGTSIQSKNNSITNYSYETNYPPSTPLWSSEIKLPFKDLNLDKNCLDLINFSIQILDGENNPIIKEDETLESSSCWATPQKLQISLHSDTPQNQTHSPASLTPQYLLEVLEITPPGYPQDTEGAQLNSLTLKLDTNAKLSDVIVRAFIESDSGGLLLGSGHFGENATLIIYPDDIYITDKPTTMSIEFEFIPDAVYLEEDGRIIPAYYAVEPVDFNFSGKYTKEKLNYEILNDSLKSNYVNIMQCTRDPECGLGEICSQEFICIKSVGKPMPPKNNITQTQKDADAKPTSPAEPKKQDDTLLYMAGGAALLIILLGYTLTKKKDESKDKKEETHGEEPKKEDSL